MGRNRKTRALTEADKKYLAAQVQKKSPDHKAAFRAAWEAGQVSETAQAILRAAQVEFPGAELTYYGPKRPTVR
jgi:hypothetical protein